MIVALALLPAVVTAMKPPHGSFPRPRRRRLLSQKEKVDLTTKFQMFQKRYESELEGTSLNCDQCRLCLKDCSESGPLLGCLPQAFQAVKKVPSVLSLKRSLGEILRCLGRKDLEKDPEASKVMDLEARRKFIVATGVRFPVLLKAVLNPDVSPADFAKLCFPYLLQKFEMFYKRYESTLQDASLTCNKCIMCTRVNTKQFKCCFPCYFLGMKELHSDGQAPGLKNLLEGIVGLLILKDPESHVKVQGMFDPEARQRFFDATGETFKKLAKSVLDSDVSVADFTKLCETPKSTISDDVLKSRTAAKDKSFQTLSWIWIMLLLAAAVMLLMLWSVSLQDSTPAADNADLQDHIP